MKTLTLLVCAAALMVAAFALSHREGYDSQIANIGSRKITPKITVVTNYTYTAKAALERE